MTIAIDNVQTTRSSTNTNSYTLSSYAVSGSVSNRILVVLASFMRTNESGVTPTGITWNSQNLTELTPSTGTSSSRSYYAGIWYLINPAATTSDIVASPGATMGGAILCALTLYDAVQVSPVLDTETYSDTTQSGSFTSANSGSEPTLRLALVVANSANRPNWTWTVYNGATGSELYDLEEGSSTTGEIAGSGYALNPSQGYEQIYFDCSTTPARTVGVAVQFQGVAEGQPAIARARLVPGMRRPHGRQGW